VTRSKMGKVQKKVEKLIFFSKGDQPIRSSKNETDYVFLKRSKVKSFSCMVESFILKKQELEKDFIVIVTSSWSPSKTK
jgi:hypothetical protein